PQTLEPIFVQRPASPLTERALLLGAQAYERSNRAADAVILLKRSPRALPQPQGDLEMAKALVASGDGAGAAIFAQRVYHTYPSTPEANDAEVLMLSLRNDLGSSYPPVLGSTMLARALKLLNSGEPLKARRELVALQSQLTGAELDTV